MTDASTSAGIKSSGEAGAAVPRVAGGGTPADASCSTTMDKALADAGGASGVPSSAAAAAAHCSEGLTGGRCVDAKRPTYLAGDIGGTNCRLLLVRLPDVDSKDEKEVVIASQIYPSKSYSHLSVVIRKFLDEHAREPGTHPAAACMAVAGPVRGNTALLTNLKWQLDGAELARELHINEVIIINDFVGIGYGLLALGPSDVVTLNGGTYNPTGPKACLGAGTGLGEAYLTWNGEAYDVWGSEGGHCDFAPRDDREFGLLSWILSNERVTRVSVERVVSGPGLPLIYKYLCARHPTEVNAEVQAQLLVNDPGHVISTFAKDNKDSLCRQALEMFVGAYGAEAGNLALKMLPSGGLFVAGGIAPKILHAILENNLFVRNYAAKGRMQELLESVPIYVVTHPQVGLLGAKVICKRALAKQGFQLAGRQENFALHADAEVSPSHSGTSTGTTTPRGAAAGPGASRAHMAPPHAHSHAEEIAMLKASVGLLQRQQQYLRDQMETVLAQTGVKHVGSRAPAAPAASK